MEPAIRTCGRTAALPSGASPRSHAGTVAAVAAVFVALFNPLAAHGAAGIEDALRSMRAASLRPAEKPSTEPAKPAASAPAVTASKEATPTIVAAAKVSEAALVIDAVPLEPTPPAIPAPAKSSPPALAVDLSGDFRFRLEHVEKEGSDPRPRSRIRARINLEAAPSENLKVQLRLATGSDDPVSTNQTLDGGFSTKGFLIDRASLSWKSSVVPGLSLTAGKMSLPFYKPGKTELIWDGDLSPEGLALGYQTMIGETQLSLVSGAFVAEERESDDDSYLVGTQLVANSRLGSATLVLGLGYFGYEHVKGMDPLYDDTDSFGNSVDGGGAYAKDYDLVEGLVQVDFKIRGVPVSIFVDGVQNIMASEDSSGILGGVSIGKARAPGSVSFACNWRNVEKDAVLGAFTDSDFAGGGADCLGYEFEFAWIIRKSVALGIDYFVNTAGLEGGNDYQRVMLDLKVKF